MHPSDRPGIPVYQILRAHVEIRTRLRQRRFMVTRQLSEQDTGRGRCLPIADHPDWIALMTGRVTAEHRKYYRQLRQRITQSGLERRIVFLGEVPDIRPWYRRLSLYVAPSRNEGFGLTPLEAMASRTAVVASDAGAYPDWNVLIH